MLSSDEAIQIVKHAFPEDVVGVAIDYRNVYVIEVYDFTPGEEGLDPFFSVDKESGELRDFSIITDGDISEISRLFSEARAG